MASVEFPYTSAPARIKPLLDKLRIVGVPDKVTQPWLESNGFKTKNDRTLIPILKYVNFIDHNGQPTELWRQNRGSEPRLVLAKGVTDGYQELFKHYPNAQSQSDADLFNFFSTRTGSGKDTVNRIVTTFRRLTELADINNAASAEPVKEADSSLSPESGRVSVTRNGRERGGGHLTVNINVQLSLPETVNEQVYDSLFSALKRHLLDQHSTDA